MPRIRNLTPDTFRFRAGQKAVFLPSFTLTLCRTPRLPPCMATFIVPRHFSKLDIKDYLWHAYGVPVLRVRSSLRYQKPQLGRYDPLSRRVVPKAGVWRYPRPIKSMTVEMAEGERGGDFVWPDAPTDLKPWDKETYEAFQKDQDQRTDDFSQFITNNIDQPKREGGLLRQQASAVKERGPANWQPSWKEYGQKDLVGGVGTFDMASFQAQTLRKGGKAARP